MTKEYHAWMVSLVGLVTFGLAVSLAPTLRSHGEGNFVGMSTALAEDDSHGESHGDSRGDSRDGDSRHGDSHDDGHDDSHHDSNDRSRHSYGSDGYDEDGYDRDGHDHDGYDREGYRDDGRRRDGSYDEGHDHRRGEHGGTSGSAQPFVVKPKINQY